MRGIGKGQTLVLFAIPEVSHLVATHAALGQATTTPELRAAALGALPPEEVRCCWSSAAPRVLASSYGPMPRTLGSMPRTDPCPVRTLVAQCGPVRPHTGPCGPVRRIAPPCCRCRRGAARSRTSAAGW